MDTSTASLSDMVGAAGRGTPTSDSESADPAMREIARLARRLLPGADSAIVFLHGTEAECLVPTAAEVTVDVRPAHETICASVVRLAGGGTGPWNIADARRHPDLKAHPAVDGRQARIRSYAAAAVTGGGGEVLGTVCAFSDRPDAFDASHVAHLEDLAGAVVTALELRERHRLLASADPVAARRVLPRGPSDWTIEAVLDEEAVTTVYQPIVHLPTGEVVGFEALSRGPSGSPLESPLALIDAAARVGRLGELDWLCRAKAMSRASAADLPSSLSWLVNVEPAGLAIACPPLLRAEIDSARTDLRVILEVIERDVEGYVTELLHATDQARRDSWGVALDDVGAELGQLALLPFLRPDVVKLDMSLLRGSPARHMAEVTAAVQAYAERTGAVILAEGIETESERSLAEVFGAVYGQGWFYGAAAPLPEQVPVPRHVIPLRQRMEPLSDRTPFDVLSTAISPRASDGRYLAHISEHIIRQAAVAQPSVLVASSDDAAALSAPINEHVDRQAPGSALTVLCAPGLPVVADRNWQQGPPEPNSRLADEWVTAVISPHHAAAFAARRTPPSTLAGGEYEYVYTHDRDLVALAMRAYLAHARTVEIPVFLTQLEIPELGLAGDGPSTTRRFPLPRGLGLRRRPLSTPA